MQVGIDVKHEGRDPGVTSRDIVELAQQAEDAGFESLWTNEDVGYDSFGILSAASQRTSTIRLGTAIVNVYVRSAMLLAMAAATLDELSDGRAILGLSTGHHPWNDLGHGIPIDSPVGRLREYVAFIRKALTGETFAHDGRFIRGVETRLETTPRPGLPIHVAGSRPQFIKLAAEVADGVIMNVVGPGYVAEFAAEHFRSSARAAGRDPDTLELTALVTCCVSDDRAEALAMARATLVHRLRNSTKLVDVQPTRYHEEIRYLHGLVQAGERERAVEEATEDLVTSVINAGDPVQVRAGLQRYLDAGCTRVVAVAFPRTRADVERTIRAVAPLVQSVA